MIEINFNHLQVLLEDEISLSDFLKIHNHCENYFAVSINKKFIPKVNYPNTVIKENDVVDLVMPMQGG